MKIEEDCLQVTQRAGFVQISALRSSESPEWAAEHYADADKLHSCKAQ